MSCSFPKRGFTVQKKRVFSNLRRYERDILGVLFMMIYEAEDGMPGMVPSKREIVTQWIRIVAGLLVFAFGVHLTIFANIGLAPWDCR